MPGPPMVRPVPNLSPSFLCRDSSHKAEVCQAGTTLDLLARTSPKKSAFDSLESGGNY